MEKKYKSLIACVVLFIIIIFLVISIKLYFKPFLFILFFYFLSKPIYLIINKIIKSKRIASGLAILLMNIILICFIYYLGSTIIFKGYKLYYNNTQRFHEIFDIIKNNGFLDTFNIDKIGDGIFSGNIVQKGAFYTGEGIISYFIANICVYFLLYDGKEIFKGILNFIPESYYNSFRETLKNLKGMLTIEAVLIIVNTLELFIGFKILNIKEAGALAMLCGVLDLLPYVGTIIVFIPLIIYNIVLKEYFVVIGLISLYILVLIIREILETKFIGNKLNLHPFIVLVAIYIGMKLFGIVGLIIGPLYILLAKEILFNGT
ncbi:Predicted PurR-regulated permease PerM [Clostridium cavendishii DSM 21758]|uniref:Predicted PurR-regulated permease PerM n=1 Tax=Clostridium cavendishii DSM 21758 TaxID=1121302 RepID=A0A1M6RLE5_9CLOT|nr:AI-2E family transporter [Clostridium cavendishii]SHK33178.1 Predicted PurR-regulated permease PerM [Clostridium cavendishii DSM 21758]